MRRIFHLSFILVFTFLLTAYYFAAHFDAPPKIKTFLDREGRFIGTLNAVYDGTQIWTPFSKIPQPVIDKTLQSEDRFFFWHLGINPVSIFKAAIDNIRRGYVWRGGSTITQQLAKNLIQENEGHRNQRTLYNKFRETLLAVGLEMRHSKKWILERYLNSVYYGHRTYGISAAGKYYFSKDLSELSSDEIEWLVLLPKAPGKSRAPLKAETSPLPETLAARIDSRFTGRHFIEYVGAQLGNEPAPWRFQTLQTSLDLDLQARVENAVAEVLNQRSEKDPLLTGAAVVIDVRTGEILAMVGSRDYQNEEISGQVNGALALRQPGSTLKPFTYFAAFSKGFTPDSLVPDEPLSFQSKGDENAEVYAPQNFDRRFHGAIPIREALANSYNVPAVATLNEIGLSYYFELLKKFGFTSLKLPPSHYGLSVTLGSGEVTLLQLTNAYATLARGGVYRPSRYLRENYSDKAENLKEKPDSETPFSSILPHAVEYAAEITDILTDPKARLKAFGFNESMQLEGHTVAVKTGTSYDHRDNWTIGYTPSYAVGVWVGHADGSPMEYTTGATGAAPVWHAIFENLIRGKPDERFAWESPKNNLVFKPDSNPYSLLPRNPGPTIAQKDWKLLSPISHMTYRLHPYLPRQHQRIQAEVKINSPKKIFLKWFLDDQFLQTTEEIHPQVWIEPVVGNHRLRVESANGETQEVSFRVIEEE